MMNDTVVRIVEIMFQDVKMNEETSAIRDEVMNNCQERYTDLTAAGMNEDDAIAAVIESLKGMEEVLAPYKKKAQHISAEGNADELEGEQHVTFAANLVSKVEAVLVNEDVNIEASDDDEYHVIWNATETPQINVELHHDMLRVVRKSGDAVQVNKDGDIEYHHKDDLADFIRTEKGKIEINMDSIEGMLKSVGSTLKNAFNNLRINVGLGDGEVTIQVPECAVPHVKLLTTSGDIKVQRAALADLKITSVSGDIDVALSEDQNLEQVEMRTTSGDMEVVAYTDRMCISSTSGDVDIKGSISDLNVSTVSGDIDIRADVTNMTFKAISGDVNMTFDSDALREVRGSTISGDIEIDLPEGIGVMGISTSTRSGDVTTSYRANGVGPAVQGSLSSMSGDITLR